MKVNSNQFFETICGSYRDSVKIDREVFGPYGEACFEAATQSIENYMVYESDVALGMFCVVRMKGFGKENDFVILTHGILRNAGHHDLAEEFKKASDVYLSAVSKKEK